MLLIGKVKESDFSDSANVIGYLSQKETYLPFKYITFPGACKLLI